MQPGARVSERWSPGRCAKVELREPPATTEDPMTDDRMAFIELLQKSGDGDFLRAVAETVLQILMEADVEGLIGAGRHERSADRLNYRNGYRERSLDTRLGSLQLRIPKLRHGHTSRPSWSRARPPRRRWSPLSRRPGSAACRPGASTNGCRRRASPASRRDRRSCRRQRVETHLTSAQA